MYRISGRLRTTIAVPFLSRGRHAWIPEEDAQLRRLVAEHSTSWTLISQKMGLGISPMSYRRRWECIESNSSGVWTMVEDKRLQRAVEQMNQLGMAPGRMYGFWVHVAEKVGGGRSPRDCYMRWATHFVPRAKHSVWNQDEKQRLNAGVDLIVEVSDCVEERIIAEKSEPWLLISTDTRVQRTLPAGFWADVASSVGTRCMHQCRKRWDYLQLALRIKNRTSGGFRMGNQLNPRDVNRLADLVERLAMPSKYISWGHIRSNYFPDMEPLILRSIYTAWKSAKRRFGMDLRSIDPESMLHDYTIITKTDSAPEGPAITAWAMRPTGADGRYDPQGALQKVVWHQQVTPITPFFLALARIKLGVSGLEASKWPHRRETGQTILADVLTVPGGKASRLQRYSSEFVDKLIESVMLHNDDMRAIAKDVGLPPCRCRPLVQELRSMLPRLAITHTHKTA